MSKTGEQIDRQQVNVRLEPELHAIMKCARGVLGVRSIDDVYTMAAEEFLANHPEVITSIREELEQSQAIAASALHKLAQFRQAPET